MEVKEVAWDHRAAKWRSWSSNPAMLNCYINGAALFQGLAGPQGIKGHGPGLIH